MKSKIEKDQANEPFDVYHIGYTYADYLKFSFDEMVEIIRGKLVKMSPGPSSVHQQISMALSTEIFNFLRNKECKTFTAPFDVVLPVEGKSFEASDRVVQPDICVICDPSKIREQGCFGAPDWIIEILSPHTAKKDLQDKFSLYEESGVGEYWIVEPRNQTVEVFVLVKNNYQRVQTYVHEDVVSSSTLKGLNVSLGQVFVAI
jgi:Uma2 family endonuclease